MHRNAKDVTGRRFGRLTAVAPTNKRAGRNIIWSFLCDCGSVTEGSLGRVAVGEKQSCGCLIADNNKARLQTHGLSRKPIYTVWRHMLDRCENIQSEFYADYGGRGIRVCDRWKSVDCFREDMGDPPFRGAQIDRIDNNGDYAPANCRWVTPRENANNKRNNRLITINGVTKTLPQWARDFGLSDKTVRSRLSMGWSEERAIKTPLRGS